MSLQVSCLLRLEEKATSSPRWPVWDPLSLWGQPAEVLSTQNLMKTTAGCLGQPTELVPQLFPGCSPNVVVPLAGIRCAVGFHGTVTHLGGSSWHLGRSTYITPGWGQWLLVYSYIVTCLEGKFLLKYLTQQGPEKLIAAGREVS